MTKLHENIDILQCMRTDVYYFLCNFVITVLDRQNFCFILIIRSRGATDNASDYGSEDWRFESSRDLTFFKTVSWSFFNKVDKGVPRGLGGECWTCNPRVSGSIPCASNLKKLLIWMKIHGLPPNHKKNAMITPG